MMKESDPEQIESRPKPELLMLKRITSDLTIQTIWPFLTLTSSVFVFRNAELGQRVDELEAKLEEAKEGKDKATEQSERMRRGKEETEAEMAAEMLAERQRAERTEGKLREEADKLRTELEQERRERKQEQEQREQNQGEHGWERGEGQ